mgnify:CR=1 FL=1|tara:strand:+ start:975 stop:1682 length:708 start_codon:yes stop_codon:yes gene_type:complete
MSYVGDGGKKQTFAGFNPTTKQQNAMSRPKEVFIDGESIKDASGDERIKFTDTGDFTVVSDTATAAGAGVSAAATNTWLVETTNGITITTGQIDITGLGSIDGDNTVIGNAGTTDAAAYLTKITHEINGYIFDVRVTCVEAPTTGEPDIDFTFDTSSTAAQTAATDQQLEVEADWTLGLSRHWRVAGASNQDAVGGFTAGLDDYFLHATAGKGSGAAGTYDAGKFVIRLLGVKVF